MKHNMGRHSKFTLQLADEICDRLSKGEPLTQICRDDHMPDRATVHDWRAVHEEFSQRFARAKDDGYDAIAMDCLNIADHTSRDTISTERGFSPNAEWIARSRLRVDTRLKLLAKWDPKRYGEKVELEHSGTMDIKVTIGGTTT